MFVDDELLQEQLVKNGLAEIKYIYGDYKYLEKLEKAEKYSQDKKLGIWKEETEEVITEIKVDTKISTFYLIYKATLNPHNSDFVFTLFSSRTVIGSVTPALPPLAIFSLIPYDSIVHSLTLPAISYIFFI